MFLANCWHACGVVGCHCNETPLCDCGRCSICCVRCQGNWIDRLFAWRMRRKSAQHKRGMITELLRWVERYDNFAKIGAKIFSDLGDRRPKKKHLPNMIAEQRKQRIIKNGVKKCLNT